ncbi:MAG TPA: UPF0182 family protein [Gemmatimonadaceae bacterium]|nr:UPF0182 family protein [Gemmatimonadaceae bacterium]
MADESRPTGSPAIVRGSARPQPFTGATGARRGRPFEARRRRWLPVLGGVLLVALLAPVAARRITDLLWFQHIGYERVFLTRVLAQWALGIGAGVFALVVLLMNARAVLRDLELPDVSAVDRFRSGPMVHARLHVRVAAGLARPAAYVLALFVGLLAASQWRVLAQFFFREPFGIADPVFGRDVAYYVFTVPFIQVLLDYAELVLFLAGCVIVLPVYAARGEIRWRRLWPTVGPIAQRHLGVLAACALVLAGLDTLLVQLPLVLQSAHASLHGAGYTDLTVRLPALRIAGAAALLAAVPVLWSAWRGRVLRGTAASVAAYALIAMLLAGIAPAAFQRLVVQPNELDREAPQIRRHIEATRRAWGLEAVESRELDPERRLTAADIAANAATITNVRLWDREPLLQTFGQLQSIRTYYDFVSVDDDRYRIGGALRQVLLSARELNPAALPTRSFINEHLTFTHGMGVTLGPSNQVTDEGLPMLWIRDLPPSSDVGLGITRPQIYFGELPNDFALAPSRQREFDYPAAQGDADVYSAYAGRAGVPAGSFVRRLLFALRFQSLNILLSRDLTPRTRVLFHRNVLDRAELALPFLRFDRDPYVVVTDSGRLEWILDAYTTSSRYPYSEPLDDGTNYMRNSVKVVIDAYDGDVTAYVADPADPMIRTLARIYPGLLHPLSEMPTDLRAHLRYPEDLFRAQTALYATFHMTDPETFYHREDQWQIPESQVSDPGDREGFIRHMVMRLPGERQPEFLLMRPFTPRQKDNLAAWMVARNDGANYGKLIAYRFPRQSLVFGPTQIVNRINQDTEVSRQVSLWDQRGSEVIRGELLVIPIEQSLIYVQPLYLRAQGGRIPELKRVIVVHEGQVVMDATLEAGLRRLFGGASASVPGSVVSAPAPAPPRTLAAAADSGTARASALIREAVQHYDRARAAQRADDWATYGAEMRQLGEILKQLQPKPGRITVPNGPQ